MNAHVPQTKDQLVELLEYILAAVRANDSMEGFLSYLMPQDGDEPCDFMVQAAFRTGNRMGQGSMILVQRIEPASTSTGSSEGSTDAGQAVADSTDHGGVAVPVRVDDRTDCATGGGDGDGDGDGGAHLDTGDRLPEALDGVNHIYLSTACLHTEQDIHDKCKRNCKYCGSKCTCTAPGCACSRIRTNMPDVASESLGEIKLRDDGPEIALMLGTLKKPRTNLGSSGPPGRVD